MLKQNDILFQRFRFRGRHYVCLRVDTDYALNVQTVHATPIPTESERLRDGFLARPLKRISGAELTEIQPLRARQLSGAYYPVTASPCQSLDLITPDSMDYETEQAILAMKQDVGGDTAKYACGRLRCTLDELQQFLSAEQVDATCMAIRAIEKGGGFILGDQTGVGKGRVAAAIIRYAVANTTRPPLFFTIKPNLFSDLYRDLCALGCAHYRPYIVNATDSNILDGDGNLVYSHAGNPREGEYDYILCTYSQINSDKISAKRREFISARAVGAICILDESHSASGASSTTNYMYELLATRASGALFMSATFAKRPDNMLLYCSKTLLRNMFETGSTDIDTQREQITGAFANGGVPLQEVVASQLVAAGQMLRRERNFSGVEVNYVTLDGSAKQFGLRDYSVEHARRSDTVTALIRRIIDFQRTYIQDIIDSYNSQNRTGSIGQGGREKLGMKNTSLFSRLFHIVDTLLFSLKAEATADLTIARVRRGEKVIIAFSKTNEVLLDAPETEQNADSFSKVLTNALRSTRFVTITNGPQGSGAYELTLPPAAAKEYSRIEGEILKTFQGGDIQLPVSPIDYIVERLEREGIAVAELTGRSRRLRDGAIEKREARDVTRTFQDFNNNLLDVLLINQTASTGASAHALVTPLVPMEQVKRRCMIILQSELDINIEIQKRGRINRTGQVLSPIYFYLHSAIPAEKRLAMMLQAKLKSLDANTTSSQKNTQQQEHKEHDDFINKYGDKIVYDWLRSHKAIADLLDLSVWDDDKEGAYNSANSADLARRATGRVAVLPTEEQEMFYSEVLEAYNEHIENLKLIGLYDLEMDNVKLNAKTLDFYQMTDAPSGESDLLGPVFIEKCEVDNLFRPYLGRDIAKMFHRELSQLAAKYGESKAGFINIPPILDQLQADFDTYMKKEIAKGKRSDKSFQLFRKKMDNFYLVKDSTEQLLKTIPFGSIVKIFDNIENCYSHAVFLTIETGGKANPSSVKFVFVTSNSRRLLKKEVFPSKNSNLFYDVRPLDKCVSCEIFTPEGQSTWDQLLAEAKTLKTRIVRYIVTGNLLQAYTLLPTELMQKIVSYTTADGKIKKGALCYTLYNEELEKYFERSNGHERQSYTKKISLNSQAFYSFLQKKRDSGKSIVGVSLFRKDSKKGEEVKLLIMNTFYEIHARASRKADLFWLIKDEELNSFSTSGFLHSRGGRYFSSFKLCDGFLGRLNELGCLAVVEATYDEEEASRNWETAQQKKPRGVSRITPLLELELKLFLGSGGGVRPPIRRAHATMSPSAALSKLSTSRCDRPDLLPLFTELKRATEGFTTDKNLDVDKYNLRRKLKENGVRPSDWLNAGKTVDRSEIDTLTWLAGQMSESKRFDHEAMAAKALHLKALALKIKLKMAIN